MGYIKILTSEGVTDFDALTKEQKDDLALAVLIAEEKIKDR